MSRPARVDYDLEAAKANLERVRGLAPRQKIMAIIKADAYGHGLDRMAAAFSAADAFGVACLEEAQGLRDRRVKHPIVLLEGPFSPGELREMQRLALDIVIHDDEQIAMLRELPQEHRLGVWLKVDSGMHRLGFAPQRVRGVWEELQRCGAVAPHVRLMTHLACAHERGHPSVPVQLACFAHASADISAERCIANSAALLAWPAAYADWVRPGIMLYGVSPFTDSSGAAEGLRPVMSVSSRLIAVKTVRAGEGVGYGGDWRCPEDMPIGIVALGYGDGYPRHARPGTPMLVNGKRTGLIGKASMDMLSVDLRPVPAARVGDPVLLWGAGLPVEEVARWAGTIPYELLCGVRGRARFLDPSEG